MMTAQYRVIMYDRQTDRVGGIIDVPAQLAPHLLSLPGIVNAAEPGEIELADKQVGAIATLLGFRANVGRYRYHLETLVTTQDRLQA
jgi:hypothetical protein